jgi:hypothetical protein
MEYAYSLNGQDFELDLENLKDDLDPGENIVYRAEVEWTSVKEWVGYTASIIFANLEDRFSDEGPDDAEWIGTEFKTHNEKWEYEKKLITDLQKRIESHVLAWLEEHKLDVKFYSTWKAVKGVVVYDDENDEMSDWRQTT